MRFVSLNHSRHSTDWRYRVVEQDAQYFTSTCGTEEITKAATNGWEFDSAQTVVGLLSRTEAGRGSRGNAPVRARRACVRVAAHEISDYRMA